jgi:hypothetical protein
LTVTEWAQPILELVVFKLKEGATREAFLGTVGAVSAWAKTQPGFVSRDLCYSAADDRWIEVVWWDTLHHAEAAADAAMSSASCAPMFRLIDMESMLFLHGQPAIATVTRQPPSVAAAPSPADEAQPAHAQARRR